VFYQGYVESHDTNSMPWFTTGLCALGDPDWLADYAKDFFFSFPLPAMSTGSQKQKVPYRHESGQGSLQHWITRKGWSGSCA